jgi:hypothetical protein
MDATFDLENCIGQLHGDWHAGLEKARTSVLSRARRVADFSHFIGAKRPGGKTAKQAEQDPDNTVHVWRSGILNTVRNITRDEMLVEQVRRLAHTTRNQFRSAFDWLWQKFFKEQESLGRHELIESLKKHYFHMENDRLESPFRTACDRVQPGSGSGSQSQESWHAHRLRPAMGEKRLGLSEVLSELEEMFRSRHQELSSSNEGLQDIPTGKYHDMYFLEGQRLHSHGEFIEQWQPSEDDNIYVVLRADVNDLTRTATQSR